MRRLGLALAAIVGIVLLGALWWISTGNSIIRKEEGVKTAWSQVENVYQRRLDLIPNLVNTVKGYTKHERETLESVIKARNQAAQTTQATGPAPDAGKLREFEQSQAALGSALSRLLVVVERYPDLKANTVYQNLQAQLEGTENRITVERRRFNEAAQDFNTYIRTFPASTVANARGVQPRAYFEAAPGAATAPKVEF